MERPQLEAPASEWLVYGDSLQESGDPRGQLVALSHGVDEGKTAEQVRDAYVREHGVALLGGAKQFLDSYVLEWRFCELVAAEVQIKPETDSKAVVLALLDAPVATQLSQLSLVAHAEPNRPIDLGGVMQLIEDRDCIRGLSLIDERARKARMLVSRDFEPGTNLVTFGTFDKLWPRLKRLKLVVADAAQVHLGTIDAPELRTFSLHDLRYGDGWGGEANPLSAVFAEAKWPQLAELDLELTETWMANVPAEVDPYVPVYSAEDYEGHDDFDDGDIDAVNWQELAGVFANVKNCPLRRLALTSFVGGRTLIPTLAAAGLAPTLVELDLSHSELDDDDVDVMFQHEAMFKQVKRMVLDGTRVTPKGLERLRGLGMEVVKDESEAGAKHRFVVGQE